MNININMKFNRSLILIALLAVAALLVANSGFANNDTPLEQHDFDSYFKMDVPKGITFEKTNSTPSKNINVTLNYKNDTEKISIIYAESAGAKDGLLKYYENLANNNTNMTLKSFNNTTVIHFKGDNLIGEDNYHDMAISGDNTKYILMLCDNETLMNSMASSIKFN